jgi:hypothetical protein
MSKLDRMTARELEDYLTPPVGTEQAVVEQYFGFPSEETYVNGSEDVLVTGYSLFYPVVMEMIYERGRVTEAGLHHDVNIADWSSERFFEVRFSQHTQPRLTEDWLKRGYIHFIRGRALLNESDAPQWIKTR